MRVGSRGIPQRHRAVRRLVRHTIAGVAAAGLVFGVSACSSEADSLSSQWEEGGDKGYVAGDGSTLSIAPSERTEAVEFSGETESGDPFGSADTLGSVTVVNFWYAGCAPCRAEAGDLVEAHEEFGPEGVQFVGVNTRDQVAQAQQFSEQFGIEYPSIMDSEGGRAVQRAFAGQVPLNAVPTTLILDSEGRVAHRILGQLAGASQLRTLINETLAEQ
ncbi:MAG: TlpA disulfide reductase family protein [Leucobacter sp.]